MILLCRCSFDPVFSKPVALIFSGFGSFRLSVLLISGLLQESNGSSSDPREAGSNTSRRLLIKGILPMFFGVGDLSISS